MRRNTRLSITSVLVAALLPVTAWSYGYFDAYGDRSYFPYAASAGDSHYRGSLRLKTGTTEDGYYVRIYLDRLRPEDIQVYLRRNHLVLQISRSRQHGLYKPDARKVSQWQMRIRRQLRLPYNADRTRISTSTENGIMEIYIPARSHNLPGDPPLNW